MLHIATLRGDMQGRFHNSLYLGNVLERVRVLREVGQGQLAYLTAKVHGLEEEAEAIATELGPEKVPTIPDDLEANSKLLLPPTPILRENNWPLLEVRKGFFDQVEAADEEPVAAEQLSYEDSGDEGDDADANLGWGDSTDFKHAAAASEGAAEAGAGWGNDLDIDLPTGDNEAEAADQSSAATAAAGDYFVMPTSGKSALWKWANNSTLAADQIAAGSFDQGMHLLHRQIGVVNFAPLKEGFLTIHQAAFALLPTLPGLPALSSPLTRQVDGKDCEFPNLAYKLSQIVEPLKSAYKNVTEGKFGAALKEFISVLQTLPLVIVDKKAEIAEVQELLGICREYITALRLELQRKDEADVVKQAALAAYFTQCKLQTTHIILGLKSAIKCAYTIKNYVLTAGFCRRLLEICSSSNSASIQAMVNVKQIRGVLQVCEKSSTDEAPIDYPEANFLLCCKTFQPIAKGKPVCKYTEIIQLNHSSSR